MAAAADALFDSLKDKKVAVGGVLIVVETKRYTHWLSNDELGARAATQRRSAAPRC